MQFELPHNQFSAKLGTDTRLQEAQAAALDAAAPLVLSVEPDCYRISVGSAQATPVLSLSGCWMSDYLRAAGAEPQDLLLLPFAFLFTRLELPPASLLTLGRDYRSLTDFFMRNFYAAALRAAAVKVEERPGALDSKTLRAAQNLAKTYGWILKSVLREPVLDRRDGPELMLAGLHADLLRLESPLLQAGLGRMRQRALARREQVEGFLRFQQVRLRVLKAMGAL